MFDHSTATGVMARGLRVLVAEDNAVLRVALRGLLRLMGHAVDVVGNGREAVERAETTDYDVVLLDIQMPEMDGLEAARAIGTGVSGRRPRVVVLSAGMEERDIPDDVGVDDFLAKPVSPRELAEALGTASRS
jgi:CheY-like chemotaxis protein